MPPTSNNRVKAPESQLAQASKEATPLPESLRNAKKPPSSTTNGSNFFSSLVLEETLNITLKYGDEYMDENPITGQPGEFHLSSTGRKEKDKLIGPASGKGPVQVPSKSSTPAPPALKTNIPPEKRGSKVEK